MVRLNSRKRHGFTLIEILVVIGIIAILAAIVIIAINPARQFAQARNSQRTSNVNAILNAVGQRIADNKGLFETGCAAGVIPTTATYLGTGAGNYDIRDCIVTTYMPEIPIDPGNSTVFDGTPPTPYFTSGADYFTGYTAQRDSTTQRITMCAPGGAEPAVSGSTAICVTR